MSAVLEGAKVGDMSKIQAELARGANIDFKDEVKFWALLGLPPHSPFVELCPKGDSSAGMTTIQQRLKMSISISQSHPPKFLALRGSYRIKQLEQTIAANLSYERKTPLPPKVPSELGQKLNKFVANGI